MNFVGRDFISTADFTQEELAHLVQLALDMKAGKVKRSLADKILVTVFFNPSLRTKISFEAAMANLGGTALNLTIGGNSWKLEHREGIPMDGDCAEHIKDAARVLERYGDALAVRCFPAMESWDADKLDGVINGFAKYADKPVINMESSLWHPCQAMADIMTVKELIGEPKGKKFSLVWAYHPNPLPTAVPNSAAMIAAQFGMDVTIAHPPGYELDGDVMKTMQERSAKSGGSVSVTTDRDEAFGNSEIIYAKSWGSLKYYGDKDGEREYRKEFRNWMVGEADMARTNNARFMHCLPVRRNVVVADAVLDGKQCAVYQQAENRMHAQMAVLAELLG